MSQIRIAELLEDRLSEWADARGVMVAWENIATDPPDSLYLQAWAMPATTDTIDLAAELQVLLGVWQINVIAKAGTGVTSARELAGQVAALFPVGLTLKEGALTCYIITPPTIYRGITSDTRYTIPVSMNYRAHLIAS